jgi:hypothetical protein
VLQTTKNLGFGWQRVCVASITSIERDVILGACELAERDCRVFGCPHYAHLSIPQEVA